MALRLKNWLYSSYILDRVMRVYLMHAFFNDAPLTGLFSKYLIFNERILDSPLFMYTKYFWKKNSCRSYTLDDFLWNLYFKKQPPLWHSHYNDYIGFFPDLKSFLFLISIVNISWNLATMNGMSVPPTTISNQKTYYWIVREWFSVIHL